MDLNTPVQNKGWMDIMLGKAYSIGGKESEGEVNQEVTHCFSKTHAKDPGDLFSSSHRGFTGADSHSDQSRCPYLPSTLHCSLVNQEPGSEATCMDL